MGIRENYTMAKKKKNIYREWSNEEIKLLKKLFPIKKKKEIADILGRSFYSVASKAHVVGLKKVDKRKWSDDEIKLLKEIYPIKRTREVAAQLGRPMPSVIHRAYIMGIRKKSFY